MGTVNKVVKKVKSGFLKDMTYELKWIFQMTKTHRKGILFYLVISLVSSLISLSISYKSKDLVDMLVGKEWGGVISLALFYVIIGCVNVALTMILQRISAVINGRIKKELSLKVYGSILGAEWEMVTKHHSGDLMSRMNEDIGVISESVVQWIPSLFIQGIQLLISLGIIIYYDFSMIVVIVLVAPIIMFGSRIFLGKVYESNKEQREVSSELTSFQKESFQNLHAVKAFGLNQYFQNGMDHLQQKRYDTDLKTNKYSISSWAVMYVSGQIAALICLGWAMYHVYKGYITLGTMTLMVVFATTISSSFKSLIQMIPNAMSTVTCSTRIRNILNLPQEEILEEEKSMVIAEKAKEHGLKVCLDQVTFSYESGKNVFEKASVVANPGEIVALVGPSGEGKTTMLRILLGILHGAKGKAFLTTGDGGDKIDISCVTRKLIAYVPQGNTMMNGTIAENMRMVHSDTTDEEIEEALKMSCAWEFVEKLPDGINHNIGESGIGFSEGQNQRLSISRALLCNTPILLLDEATSALDVTTERNVLQNIMKKDANRTCILTTHRPTVLAMCDKVYRIANQQVMQINEEQIRELMNDF